jgi:multidrug efflux pump subunit AcrA (membrane-fusion protein)
MNSAVKRGRTRNLLLIALAVLLVAAGAAWAYRHFSAAAQPEPKTGRAKGKAQGDARPIPVVADAAHLGDIHIYLSGLGTVVPLRTVTVRSRVDGELIRVPFTEGQEVKAGELLAEVDPRPFQVQLAQAGGQRRAQLPRRPLLVSLRRVVPAGRNRLRGGEAAGRDRGSGSAAGVYDRVGRGCAVLIRQRRVLQRRSRRLYGCEPADGRSGGTGTSAGARASSRGTPDSQLVLLRVGEGLLSVCSRVQGRLAPGSGDAAALKLLVTDFSSR